MAKSLQHQPKDPDIRDNYERLQRRSIEKVKGAKRAYEVDAIRSVESKADNQKEFWDFLNAYFSKIVG